MPPRVPTALEKEPRFVEERIKTYEGVDVFLLCFSVFWGKALANIGSFWIPEIRKTLPDVPFVIVGTKTDFRPGFPGYRPGSLRMGPGEQPDFVDFLAAKDFARNNGAFDYLECAALAGSSGANGVNAVFLAASKAAEAHMLMNQRCSCCLI